MSFYVAHEDEFFEDSVASVIALQLQRPVSRVKERLKFLERFMTDNFEYYVKMAKEKNANVNTKAQSKSQDPSDSDSESSSASSSSASRTGDTRFFSDSDE